MKIWVSKRQGFIFKNCPKPFQFILLWNGITEMVNVLVLKIKLSYLLSKYINTRGIHVILVSFFGQPIVWSISNFFGRPNENCPISETGQFFWGQPKKVRNWLDNWSAMRLPNNTWTSLICNVLHTSNSYIKSQKPFTTKGNLFCKQCLQDLQFMKKSPPHQTFPC